MPDERSQDQLQREISAARDDLVENVHQLEHLVRERLEPRWYLHRAAARGRAWLTVTRRDLGGAAAPILFAGVCAVLLAFGAFVRGARR